MKVKQMKDRDWHDTLNQELDEWNFAGVAAKFWWRDDDAVEHSDALARLLELSRRYEAPLALAVIPHTLKKSLAAAVNQMRSVAILQHGYAHTNHAAHADKKIELGGRAPQEIYKELKAGQDILRQQFGAQFLEVVVPPWNRISDDVLDGLAQCGFSGISTYGARDTSKSKLRVVNTHADIINWRAGKKFIGAAVVVEMLVKHLRGKRRGEYVAEASGLLTHHLVHDEDSWNFLAELFALLDEHPAAKWQSATDVFI